MIIVDSLIDLAGRKAGSWTIRYNERKKRSIKEKARLEEKLSHESRLLGQILENNRLMTSITREIKSRNTSVQRENIYDSVRGEIDNELLSALRDPEFLQLIGESREIRNRLKEAGIPKRDINSWSYTSWNGTHSLYPAIRAGVANYFLNESEKR